MLDSVTTVDLNLHTSRLLADFTCFQYKQAQLQPTGNQTGAARAISHNLLACYRSPMEALWTVSKSPPGPHELLLE